MHVMHVIPRCSQSITMWHWSPWDALPSICSVKPVLKWQKRWSCETNSWQRIWDKRTLQTSLTAFKTWAKQANCETIAVHCCLAIYFALLCESLQTPNSFPQTDSFAVLKIELTQKLRFSNLHFVIVWSVSTWCQLGCFHCHACSKKRSPLSERGPEEARAKGGSPEQRKCFRLQVSWCFLMTWSISVLK